MILSTDSEGPTLCRRRGIYPQRELNPVPLERIFTVESNELRATGKKI